MIDLRSKLLCPEKKKPDEYESFVFDFLIDGDMPDHEFPKEKTKKRQEFLQVLGGRDVIVI